MVLDFETEVKESNVFKVCQTGLKCLTKIGAGALAGAACALIPTDKMSPFKRFCVGAGAYGIAQWVGRSAAEAAGKDFEDTTQLITDCINAVDDINTSIKNVKTDSDEDQDQTEETTETTEESDISAE